MISKKIGDLYREEKLLWNKYYSYETADKKTIERIFKKLRKIRKERELLEQGENLKKFLISRKNILIEIANINSDYIERAQDLPDRIERIIKWYEKEKNQKSGQFLAVDPNLYEFMEVAGDAARYLSEKKESVTNLDRVYEGIGKLGNIVANRLVENELATEGDALHGMVTTATDKALAGEYDYLPYISKKIAGVGEYLAKLKRSYRTSGPCSPFEYGNEIEYANLVFLMKLSTVLEKETDTNRQIVFSAIQKWHEQPIYIDNVDDYSFSITQDVAKKKF